LDARPDRPPVDATAPEVRPPRPDAAVPVVDVNPVNTVDMNTGPCLLPTPGAEFDPIDSLVWVDPDRLGAAAVVDRLVKWLFQSGPQPDVTARIAGCHPLRVGHVRALVDQLFIDPRAQVGLMAQFQTWLAPDGLQRLEPYAAGTPGPTGLPALPPELRASMLEEPGRFGLHAVLTGTRFDQLMTGSYSLMDGRLAAHYGIAGLPPTAPFTVVPFAADAQRTGVLTMAAVTSVGLQADRHSPPIRGKLILERMLCSEIPPPPRDLPPKVDPPPPGMTLRQSLEASFVPLCIGCHQILGLGWALERFDAVGRLRDSDNGQPIDTHVDQNLLYVPRGIDGARALGRALAESVEARNCFVDHMFGIALGFDRPLADRLESSTTPFLRTRFQKSGGSVRELLLDIATTADFHRQRR
jgi:hypothetical protein